MTLVCACVVVCVCVHACRWHPEVELPFQGAADPGEKERSLSSSLHRSPWRRSSELLRFLSVTSKILRSNVTRSQRENQEGHENPEEKKKIKK